MIKDIDVACRNDLIALAEAYAKNQDLALTTVSTRFHGNQAFLENLRNGDCGVTTQKVREIVDAFSDTWPRTVAWPAKFLARPRRGIVYAVTWRARPDLVKFGFTASMARRAVELRGDASRAADALVPIAEVRGSLQNERSIHRFLQPHARRRGERGWYPVNNVVESFLTKFRSPDFVWGRCRELIEADQDFAPISPGNDLETRVRRRKIIPTIPADQA